MERPEPIGRPRVTQRVAPEALPSLFARPRRAALAFAGDGGPVVVPVAFERQGDAIRVGLARACLPADGPPQRAVLLVDAGRYWFELRAITWRGALAPIERAGGDADPVWLAYAPDHAVAWDYGTLHVEAGA